jgi:hypothetical protein
LWPGLAQLVKERSLRVKDKLAKVWGFPSLFKKKKKTLSDFSLTKVLHWNDKAERRVRKGSMREGLQI